MRFGIAIVLVLTLASGVSPVASQKPLSASDGWIKMPGAAATATAAFVVVDNPTMYDVYLVEASTEVARLVQFRQAVVGADAKETKEVTAPAYSKVEMTADGVHLWLVDLKRPLKVGETITISMTTDAGISLNAAAVVR